ncbi:MAG TPA: DUF488 family protein [Verrucomicrobiae bacterium]|jgi:uncharacterized protein YeaO (DUF488 family)|nr:DUF488 family protein [Verrucomicrobiae bacterium]
MSRAKHKVQIKRVYDKLSADDGACFLVDRIWPRGVSKSAMQSAIWLRDVAPSAPLRKWFAHEPAKWPDFQKRYRGELQKNRAACEPLLEAMRKGDVTLLFAAKDLGMNNAAVLKGFLEQQAGKEGGGSAPLARARVVNTGLRRNF